jgi:hypothetical protein
VAGCCVVVECCIESTFLNTKPKSAHEIELVDWLFFFDCRVVNVTMQICSRTPVNGGSSTR